MNKIVFIVALGLLSSGMKAQDISFDSLLHSISEKELINHVYTLASDTMKGRNTGDYGQKMAAQYLSDYFSENQLVNLSPSVPYYQKFNLFNYEFGESKLYFINEKEDTTYRIKVSESFISSTGKELEDTLDCVFIGYGTDKELAGLTIDDKAVAVLFESTKKTIDRCKEIKQKHNIKVFYLLVDYGFAMPYGSGKYTWQNSDKSTQFQFAFDYLGANFLEEHLESRKMLVADMEETLRNSDSLSMFFVRGWATQAFGLSFSKMERFVKQNQQSSRNNLLDVPVVKSYCSIHHTIPTLDTIETENVAGFIPGTDLKNECIVVTAHYDHIGMKDTAVCYGADDNASGTAAIMEIAEACAIAKQNGFENRRSILFLALSGEEKGLRGADYYVNNPLIPLDSTVLAINLDMIGRNRKDKDKYAEKVFSFVKGNKKHLVKTSLYNGNKSLNHSLILDKTPGLKERFLWKSGSDHYCFRKNGVPVLVLFTGLHPDYHTPDDTPEKINYEKLTQISRLSFKTIWELANTDITILTDKPRKVKKDSMMDKYMQ